MGMIAAWDSKFVPRGEQKVLGSSCQKGVWREESSWEKRIERGEGDLGLVFDLRLKIATLWEVEHI